METHIQHRGGGRTETVMRMNEQNLNEKKIATPEEIEDSLRLIDEMKFFLATAPVNWQENQVIRRYYLNSDQGFASCVFWNNLFYITGTDIVKCCIYRMQKFGRKVVQKKKFEEGIFSDLRHLKCGLDATLEQPKSEFLSFLFKNMCLKTQKKQKVFFWFSVPHDKLFADALERDLKRESLNQTSTTAPVSEPAVSFKYDSSSEVSLYQQLSTHVDITRTSNPSYRGSQFSPTVSQTQNSIEDEVPSKYISQNSAKEKKADAATSDNLNEINNRTPASVDSKINNGYSQQTLVIDHDAFTKNDQYMPLNTAKSDMLNKLVNDDDDFPLDYVPIEIEYPSQEEVQDNFGGHMGDMLQPSATLYENPMLFPEDEGMPTTMPLSKFNLSMSTPQVPWPISSTRAHFMMNGDYYASSSKNTPGSPKKAGQKKSTGDVEGIKYENEEDDDDQNQFVDDNENDQYQAQMYSNPYHYQMPFNGTLPPQNGMMNPYVMDQMPMQMDPMGYGYQDFYPPQENFDDPTMMQQDGFGWGFPNGPPGMQPQNIYMSKIYSQQGYRQPQVQGRGYYPSKQSNAWGMSPSTSYHSRNNSKNNQNIQNIQNIQSTRPQPNMQPDRWRHFNRVSQPSSTNKFYFSKSNSKVNKPNTRKQQQMSMQRQQRMASVMKKNPNINSDEINGVASDQLPMLTPESTQLPLQTENTSNGSVDRNKKHDTITNEETVQ